MFFNPSRSRHALPASSLKSVLARALIAATVLFIAGSASGDGGEELDPRIAPLPPRPITPLTTLVVPADQGSGTYLAGSWNVTSAGVFTYSIPLEVPEGRNGMQPSLSLSYSSSTRNGLLGVGWSLSGFSRITRCNKTWATEGVVDGVDYSNFVTDDNKSVDRFCLDGQKLVEGVALNGDAKYGKNGAEYRTEADIFARITSTVSNANSPLGPDSFTVEMKSGIIREYLPRLGTRKQSNVALSNGVLTASEVNLGLFPVEWLLRSERDRSGNEVHYDYYITSTGYLPKKISYTNNVGYFNANVPVAAKNAQRFVDFIYDVRPDTTLAWQGGVLATQDQRLTTIVMSAPNPASVSKVWEYNLGYEPSVGSGRSLLTSVKRCGALGGCTRAKLFDWYQGASPTFTATTIAPATANVEDPANAAGYIPGNGNQPTPMYSDLNIWVPPTTKVFDADGDGLDDVLYYPGQDGGPTDYATQVRLGYRAAGTINPLGHGFPAMTTSANLFSNVGIISSRPVDIDGDGSVELWAELSSSSYTTVRQPLHWQSQPPGFVPVDIGVPELHWFDGDVHLSTDFVDLNGDGLLDMITGRVTAQYGAPELRYRMNQGGNSFGGVAQTGLAGSCGVRVTDLDGDGRGDAVIECGAGGTHRLSQGDPGGAGAGVSDLTNIAIAPGPGVHFGDFNGDGLEDVLFYEATGTTPAKILWNTGNGYVPDSHTIVLPHDIGWQVNTGWALHPFADEGIRILDVDGDGRSDIVSFHKLPTPNITLLLSQGTGVFTHVDLGQDPGFRDAKGGWGSSQLGDFNGDDRPDIITISGSNMVMLAQDPSYSDRLEFVTDELTPWAREEINYSNEWSDLPDAKGDCTCAYPLHCIRHGFPVVRSVLSRAHLVDPSFIDLQVGARRFSYSYEDPVSDLRGRGFLGFGTFRVWDPSRPMETITKFGHRAENNGIYPGAFRPRSVTTVVPILTQDEVAAALVPVTARVTQRDYVYELRSLNSGISHAVFPFSSTTKEWDQSATMDWQGSSNPAQLARHILNVDAGNTSPQREVFSYGDIDDYGNPLLSVRWTTGGVTETVSDTYEYRTAFWLVGLPLTHCVYKLEDDPTKPPVERCQAYTHDVFGRLDTASIEDGNLNPDIPETTTVSYDDLGLPTTVSFSAAGVPPRTAHTEYAPMLPGQPDERVFPSQVWAEHDVLVFRPSNWMVYHPGNGLPVTMMDVNGVQDQIQYDDLGRPVSMQHDGDAEVKLSHSGRPDLAGGVNGTITQLQEGFQTAQVVADALDRPLRGSHTGFDGSMVATIQTYDILGHMVQSAEPLSPLLNRTTRFKYDSLNRLLESLLPDGTNLVTTYPSMFVTHSLDASNNETDVTRDVDGRIVTSANILNTPVPGTLVTTAYSYAPFDQLDRVTDDAGLITQMHYDVRGRQIQVDDPDQGTTTFNYDGFGSLYRTTHAASGQVKYYSHDDLGRLTETSDIDGITKFGWDASPFGIGQMAWTLSPDNIGTIHRYDSAGRSAGMDLIDDQSHTYSVDMDYVAAGGPLSGKPWTLSYPEVPGRARFSVSNSYNNSGYVKEISGNVTAGQGYKSLWEVTSRNRDLALLQGILGNNTDVVREYEALTSRISTLKATGAAPMVTPVVDMEYDYYPNSLLKSRKDKAADRGETFEYDSLLRLSKWTLKNHKDSLFTQYSYDSIGNLLEVDENQHMVEFNIYGTNGAHPHTLTDHLNGSSNTHDLYTYDTLGRQLSGGGRTIPSYSAFDLPKTLSKNGMTWNLAYDAFGQRVKKTGPDGTTIYVGGLYERRESSAGTQHVFHVDGTDGPVAEVIFDGTTTTPSYLVTDPLGSAAVVLDAAGTVTDRFFHQPFGKRINADGTTFSGATGPMKNGFTGQEGEDAFGLINFKGRMYDPALKRFMSADPFVSFPRFGQSWNPYSYVLNSPLNFTDPSGLESEEVKQVCTALKQCYPTGVGVDVGGGSGLIGDETSASTGTGHFGSMPVGSAGDTSHGGGGGDATKSDGSGSRQVSVTIGGAVAAAGNALSQGVKAVPTWGSRVTPVVGPVVAGALAFLGVFFYHESSVISAADEQVYLDANKARDEAQKKAAAAAAAAAVPLAKHTPEQEALIDMAKKDKQAGGITAGDMEGYKQLNAEAGPKGFPEPGAVRGPEVHPLRTPQSKPGAGQKPHGHVGPIAHIPVRLN